MCRQRGRNRCEHEFGVAWRCLWISHLATVLEVGTLSRSNLLNRHHCEVEVNQGAAMTQPLCDPTSLSSSWAIPQQLLSRLATCTVAMGDLTTVGSEHVA